MCTPASSPRCSTATAPDPGLAPARPEPAAARHAGWSAAAGAALAAASLLLGGCATLTGEPHQKITVQTLDERGRPLEMRCHVRNAAGDTFGSTPMYDVQIRRSSSDLEIECRDGARIARATAVSRGGGGLAAIIPGGSASLLVDHVSGYAYAYPTWLQLRVGQTLVFDAGSRIAGRPTPGLQAEAR